jgi:hypothetical protein
VLIDEHLTDAFQKIVSVSHDWTDLGEMVIGNTEYHSLEHVVLVLVTSHRPRTLHLPPIDLYRARQALGEFIPARPVMCWTMGKLPVTPEVANLHRRTWVLAQEGTATVEHLWAALLEQNIPWLPAYLDRLRSLPGDLA